MFLYIFFIIGLFKVINAVVENENVLINHLLESNNICTLNINSEIDITKEIKINSSIQRLYIIGDSLDKAKLNLKYPLYFDSSIEEVVIENINIDGNLFFKNNEKITINAVNLNGYIDSDFDDNNSNEYIEITKLNYKPLGEPVENCINLVGNIKINKSNFYGNSSCQNRLLHYNGLSKYSFDLKESFFNGAYECPFLNIENALNANIETSYFEKGYSSSFIDGGVGVISTFSNVNIKNCTFNDILSYNDGGAFNFKNNYNVECSNLNFNNVTSLGLGSIFQISSEEKSQLKLRDITQQNTGNIKNMRGGGLIMNIEGNVKVVINSYHGENLINYEKSGSAFIISGYSKLIVKNMYLKNLIGNGGSGGLFYTSHDSFDVEFNSYNVTLYDLYQLSRYDTSIIYIDKNNYFNMNGLKLYNSGGYKTNFMNIIDNSYLSFLNSEINYFESKTIKEFFNYESERNYYNEGITSSINTINNIKVSNIISQGALFRIKNGSFKIYNSEFKKIHECYRNNNCANLSTDTSYVHNAEFLICHGDKENEITFDTVNVDQMYGDKGFFLHKGRVTLYYCTINNSYLKNGIFYLDELDRQIGFYIVWYSHFKNNIAERGTIFNIPHVCQSFEPAVNVCYCTFANNTASLFGGVLYTIEAYNINRFFIMECTFTNNNAKFGNIIYAYSKGSMPSIGTLRQTDVSTVPSHFKMYRNKEKEISILSGESISEDIVFKLYDDSNNQMLFPQKTNNIQFEDLVYFNVEINDTYNAKVLGQTRDYCWNEVCTLPPVKVIGNPGVYTLSLKFKSFGIYPKFVKDSADIQIEIRKCNEKTHNNEVIGNTHLKSCYVPKCEFNCNQQKGKCINNDLCDCTGTNFKGKFCNEYIMLERHSKLDIFLITISYVLIFIIVIVIGMTIYYRNNSIIKGGGYEFLILILIGLIINSINSIFLTFEKTTYLCYQTYLFSNMGFSFVFGSIFVKTYRIYKIFCERARYNVVLKKKTMALIIILITSFHWMMVFMWHTFESITVVNDYTAEQREYVKCKYPQSKYISSLFNFSILVFECMLSYFVKNVDKKFKETLAIPAYVYIIYMLFMLIMEKQDVINVVMLDYFDIIGTTINTLIIIYDLFIVKFIVINSVNKKIVTNSRNNTKIEENKIKSNKKNVVI